MLKTIIALFFLSFSADSFSFEMVDERVLKEYRQHYKEINVEFCVDERATVYRTSYKGGSRLDRIVTASLVESVLSHRPLGRGCYKMRGEEWGEVRNASLD